MRPRTCLSAWGASIALCLALPSCAADTAQQSSDDSTIHSQGQALTIEDSNNCGKGPGPSRCVTIMPVSDSSSLSAVDGKVYEEEYRFAAGLPYADVSLNASDGMVLVTVDKDPTSAAGAKLRVFMFNIPATTDRGKVSVVLDHNRFTGTNGNFVSSEDRAYTIDLRTGALASFKGNVNPQDPSQPAWISSVVSFLNCIPGTNICNTATFDDTPPWEGKVSAIETIHPQTPGNPDYYRFNAEFSITLPQVPVSSNGALPGIGLSANVRSDWPDSRNHVWGASPEQAAGSYGFAYPMDRSLMQTILFSDHPQGQPMSLMTWNVKRFTKFQQKSQDLFNSDAFDGSKVDPAAIGKSIAGYDVVALQEVWDSEQGQEILKAANAVDPSRPYYSAGPVQTLIPPKILPDLESLLGERTGGNYTLSRYPITGMGQEIFDQCVGEDCLYPKGVFWTRVWLGAPTQEYQDCVKNVVDKELDETNCPLPSGAQYVDVLNTHLNADPEICGNGDWMDDLLAKVLEFTKNLPESINCPFCNNMSKAAYSKFYCGERDPVSVRKAQAQQISDFIKKKGLDQRQVIIVGDFNIDGKANNEPEYLGLIEALGIRSSAVGATDGDLINPFAKDFDWDIDRGDVAHEQFPYYWDPLDVGTYIGAKGQITDINQRYDYVFVRAANTLTPSHVIAKGDKEVWRREWMGPGPGNDPDRYSDHLAVTSSLQVVQFEYPPKYHKNWAHEYKYQTTYAIGEGDDGWAGGEEELYAQIAQWKLGGMNTWKTGNCSTSSAVVWPDACLGSWGWSDPYVFPNSSFHGGGVHLWEDDDSSSNDDYGTVATPHGRDGMQMFFEWNTANVAVRDWDGCFTPHGWADFQVTDSAPVGYCGVDGTPTACMETTVREIQP